MEEEKWAKIKHKFPKIKGRLEFGAQKGKPCFQKSL